MLCTSIHQDIRLHLLIHSGISSSNIKQRASTTTILRFGQLLPSKTVRSLDTSVHIFGLGTRSSGQCDSILQPLSNIEELQLWSLQHCFANAIHIASWRMGDQRYRNSVLMNDTLVYPNIYRHLISLHKCFSQSHKFGDHEADVPNDSYQISASSRNDSP